MQFMTSLHVIYGRSELVLIQIVSEVDEVAAWIAIEYIDVVFLYGHVHIIKLTGCRTTSFARNAGLLGYLCS